MIEDGIKLSMTTFETYYVYAVGEHGTVSYMASLPCLQCGAKGLLFVHASCALCGEPFDGVYCAESYSERGDGTALALSPLALVCTSCQILATVRDLETSARREERRRH